MGNLLERFIVNRSPVFNFIFHIVLGIISTFSPYFLIIWFYLLILSSIGHAYSQLQINNHISFIHLIVYIVSFEILARMTKTYPFIPYELSKYLLFIFLLIGISFKSRSFRFGWVLFILLIPSLFFDLSTQVKGYEIYSFNLLGPLNLSLVIIYFSKHKINLINFKNLLLLLLYPLVSVLSFAFYKTPDFDDFNFKLSSNFATSGGFGSNQVSTVLGLGFLILFVFLILKWKLSKYYFFELLLSVGFLFQGLITFSRGGMLGAFISIILILFSFIFSLNKIRVRISKFYILLFVITLFGSVFYANTISDGLLFKRYQGETEGTLGGYRDKDINVATSNRFDIFLGDIELWKENPIFGVGIGASRYLRPIVNDVIAHVELSRLLAEHGLFGLLYFILILFIPPYIIFSNKSSDYKYISFAFFILAIFTTFHAAMRTYVTPLLIGISVLYIRNTKTLITKKTNI